MRDFLNAKIGHQRRIRLTGALGPQVSVAQDLVYHARFRLEQGQRLHSTSR